jgi:DNA topoisomerase-3
MDNTISWMRASPAGPAGRQQQTVWRAKFSAITAPEIRAAMAGLGRPNAAEAAAVDARQELDLKVG